MASTLKMVADLAGVSVRTAGRAFHGDGPVKAEVAKRVLAAAKELAYVPNAAARNLRVKNRNTVGVIVPPNSNIEINMHKITYLSYKLRTSNRQVLIGSLPESSVELLTLLHSWTGLVDFVVFLSWNELWSADELLSYLPMRHIFIDCDPLSGNFDRLLTARAEGVKSAVEALIQRGCSSIAHILTGANGRSEGFWAAINSAKSAIKAIEIPCQSCDFIGGYDIGRELIASGADGVFFDADRIALGFYRYAHEHDIKIPKDIAVVGFDNDVAGDFAIPKLSTVAHPYIEEVDRAIEIITNPAPLEIKTITYPTQLLCRESI